MDKQMVSMDGDSVVGRPSETSSDGERNYSHVTVNQSTRAWMWHKSSPSTVKRAHSEQMEGHHLWHSRHANSTRKTFASQVSIFLQLQHRRRTLMNLELGYINSSYLVLR